MKNRLRELALHVESRNPGKILPRLTDSASGLAHVPDLLVGLALVDTYGQVAREEIGLRPNSIGVFWASISRRTIRGRFYLSFLVLNAYIISTNDLKTRVVTCQRRATAQSGPGSGFRSLLLSLQVKSSSDRSFRND